MLEYSEATINKLVIHGVGNKTRDEGMVISDHEIQINDALTESLVTKYFFNSFKDNLVYQFKHHVSLGMNTIYSAAKSIFNNPNNFYEQSINILNCLYDNSLKGSIKNGELFVAYISGASIDGLTVDAIGIFKTENRDFLLKVESNNQSLELNYLTGTNVNKLDKGCLIFNIDEDNGYRIALVDKGSTKKESYWKHDFLDIQLVNNNFVKTKAMIEIIDEFAGDMYDESIKEKVIFVNNAVDYFNNNIEFTLEEFNEHILEDDSKPFNEFMVRNDVYRKIGNLENFDISEKAVQAMKRKIKGLIKLDTNIEIKIDSNDSDLLEKGFDEEKQMNYYKVFFNEEK